MTPTFKELADGLREAGEGRTEGPWEADLSETGIMDTATPYLAVDCDNGHSVLCRVPYRDILAREMPAEENTRFISYCGTNADGIIEALERAAKIEDALRELIFHHNEDEGMEDEPDDEAVGWVWNEDDGDHTKPMSLTFGVLRRARAALKGGETA